MPHNERIARRVTLMILTTMLAAPVGAAAAPGGFGLAGLPTLGTDSETSVRTVAHAQDGQLDERALALGGELDIETLVAQERERLEARDAVEDELDDVISACVAERDSLRATARAADTVEARAQAQAQMQALVQACNAEIDRLQEDLRELDAQRTIVQLDHPRLERLLDTTRARLAAEDRLEDVREACAERQEDLGAEASAATNERAEARAQLRVERLSEACEDATERLELRIRALEEQEQVLQSGPQATILFKPFVEQQREREDALETLRDVEDRQERVQAACDARIAAGQDVADRCDRAMAVLDARHAEAQAHVTGAQRGIDAILDNAGGTAPVVVDGAGAT